MTADSLESYGPAGLMLVLRERRQGQRVLTHAPEHRGRGAEADRLALWTSRRYGMEEFEGIVSETLMRTLDKKTGATRLMWRKIAPRNEPLDLLVYSLAMVSPPGRRVHAGTGRRYRRRRRPGERRMSRAPVYRHEVEYGEAIAYSPPTGATKWLAWRKTDLQSTFGDHDAGYAVYGGEPPTWTEIGGYDITGDEVIEFTNTGVVGFKDIATATGAAVTMGDVGRTRPGASIPTSSSLPAYDT